MGTQHFYLVRHGQYDETRKEDHLSELGVEQAILTAKALARLPAQKIYSSTLPRALETAQTIAQALPDAELILTDDLKESIPYIPQRFYRRFLINVPDLTEEKVNQNRLAIERAFDTCFLGNGDTDHVIMVGHGNTLRYLMCRALDISLEKWPQFTSLNCSITTIIGLSDGTRILESFNEVGHLPPELHTDNFYNAL